MSTRTVQLLHVEDDLLQQRLVAGNLRGMQEPAFAIVHATTEMDALRAFNPATCDLVILDYHLKQGDGLSLLRQLRRLDPLVPTIALSGRASSEVAAELVAAGADDFLCKRGLTCEALAGSVRAALLRADRVRQRAARAPERNGKVEAALADVCNHFAAAAGPDFVRRLDELEALAREAHVGEAALKQMFNNLCTRLDAVNPLAPPSGRQLLRPLFVEMLVRLFGSRGASASWYARPGPNAN
jgi:DNA-binding response OmpR family regulator